MSILIRNHRNSDDTFSVNKVTYDAVKKRNITVSVGIIKIGEEIPASITDKMTKPEIAEMTYQWSEIKQSVRKVELSDVTDKLASVCNETLESMALDAVSPDNAKSVIKLLDATRRALKSILRASEPAQTEIVEPEKREDQNAPLPEQITIEPEQNEDTQEEKPEQINTHVPEQNLLTNSGYWNRRD